MTKIILTDLATSKQKTGTTTQNLEGAMEVFKNKTNGRLVENTLYATIENRRVKIEFFN